MRGAGLTWDSLVLLFSNYLWLSDAGGGDKDKKVLVKYHTLELKNTFATKGPENGR